MKISDITEATGLNQAQIAARLGLHRSSITRWAERGIPDYREAQMREMIALHKRESAKSPESK